MFRAKVRLDEKGDVKGVAVYDPDKPEGERWVEIEEFEPETIKGFVEHRTSGVFAMLGRERVGQLVEFCYDKAKEYPGKIGGYEGTEGRGLQQTAADLLAI